MCPNSTARLNATSGPTQRGTAGHGGYLSPDGACRGRLGGSTWYPILNVVLHTCYISTAALSRKQRLRTRVRIQNLVGGPGFEPGASRSRTVLAVCRRVSLWLLQVPPELKWRCLRVLW
jgi:hypothetical protein